MTSAADLTMRRAPRLAQAEHEEEGFLLFALALVPDGTPIVLQGSAAVIWRCAEDGMPVSELVAAVADCYEVDPEEIRSTVTSFLDQLCAAGFLVLQD